MMHLHTSVFHQKHFLPKPSKLYFVFKLPEIRLDNSLDGEESLVYNVR